MSIKTVSPAANRTFRMSRINVFRIVASIVAVVFIVLFEAWRAILAPWLALPNSTEHGWERSAELHAPADAASGVLMLSVGAAALLLAIQPFRRSTLIAWVAATLTIICVGMGLSTFLQGHAGPAGALLTGFIGLLLFVVPLVLLYPDRRAILSGGAQSNTPGPAFSVVLGFALMGLVSLAAAVAVVWWRTSGGLIEDPLEDDAVSLAMLGVSIALGFMLCARGREGWSLVAWMLAGMVACCSVVGLTFALS